MSAITNTAALAETIAVSVSATSATLAIVGSPGCATVHSDKAAAAIIKGVSDTMVANGEAEISEAKASNLKGNILSGSAIRLALSAGDNARGGIALPALLASVTPDDVLPVAWFDSLKAARVEAIRKLKKNGAKPEHYQSTNAVASFMRDLGKLAEPAHSEAEKIAAICEFISDKGVAAFMMRGVMGAKGYIAAVALKQQASDAKQREKDAVNVPAPAPAPAGAGTTPPVQQVPPGNAGGLTVGRKAGSGAGAGAGVDAPKPGQVDRTEQVLPPAANGVDAARHLSTAAAHFAAVVPKMTQGEFEAMAGAAFKAARETGAPSAPPAGPRPGGGNR